MNLALLIAAFLPTVCSTLAPTGPCSDSPAALTASERTGWIPMTDGQRNGLDYRTKTSPNQFFDSGYCTEFEIRSRYTERVRVTFRLTLADGSGEEHTKVLNLRQSVVMCFDTRRIASYAVLKLEAV